MTVLTVSLVIAIPLVVLIIRKTPDWDLSCVRERLERVAAERNAHRAARRERRAARRARRKP
jgi:hypothetical protein